MGSQRVGHTECLHFTIVLDVNLSYLVQSLQDAWGGGVSLVIPILQRRKLRLREIDNIGHNHMTGK